MTRKVYVLGLILVFLNVFSCKGQNAIKEPKSYIAYKTTDSIVVDGLANEKSWQNAIYSDLFIDIEGIKKPKYNTKVKMLWDNNYFYFFAELEDPHVWGDLKQRDTIIYYNNDFEIFIDPDNDTHNYYEFEFNALNTVWDLFLTKPYREGATVLNDWDALGIKSAVHINGTINNPADIDKGWQIEIAIPLSVFKKSYHEKIELKNTFWRVNFSRVHWDFQLHQGKYQRKKDAEGNFQKEYNWVWSPQGVIAMHQPETWGYVYFSEEKSSFDIPKDEYIKWHLFKLHNNLRDGKIKPQNVETTKVFFGQNITPVFQKHEVGYNIWVVSPFSGEKIIITHQGEIILK